MKRRLRNMGEMKFCNYWNLKGFDDPVKCRASKRRITMDRITNGKMKCKEKNRFKIALLIENSLQIHNTIVSPM